MGTGPAGADLTEDQRRAQEQGAQLGRAQGELHYPQHLIRPDMPCLWCFEQHGPGVFLCPSAKSYEFDPTGRVVRVDFLVPADFGRAQPVLAPESPDYPRKGPKIQQEGG